MAKRKIAVIGAGGKTTSMELLAWQGLETGQYSRALVTTSTHIYPMGPDKCRVCLIDPTAHALAQALEGGGIICAGSTSKAGKLGMLPSDVLDAGTEAADLVVYEADGAFHHPIKIYKENEPVILPDTDRCLVVAGLSAYGKTIEESIFRYERHRLWKDCPNQIVGIEEFFQCVMASVRASGMIHDRIRVLLNQADALADPTAADLLVSRLQAEGLDVCAGSLQQASDFLFDWVVK